MTATTSTAIDIDQTADALADFWSQQTVGEANGNLLKVAKGVGSTNWHSHDDQDEVFLVTHGHLNIEMRDRTVTVGPGELFVIPTGVEHRPAAGEVVRFLIIGRSITSNTAGGKPDLSSASDQP